MPVDPVGPRQENPAKQTRYREDTRIGRRRPEERAYPQGEEEPDQKPERPQTESIFRACRSNVESDAGRVDQSFDDERPGHRVPQTEAHIWSPRKHRHVRRVHQDIENPVADDAEKENEGGPQIAPDDPMNRAEENAPHDQRRQAVAPRIVVEVQGAELHQARNDANVLDPRENEHGPDQIRPLDSEEERADRNPRSRSLGGEPDAEVTDEHSFSCRLTSRPPQECRGAGESRIGGKARWRGSTRSRPPARPRPGGSRECRR